MDLKLVESLEEPPRLNVSNISGFQRTFPTEEQGKEIGAVLGINPGREIGEYMEHVVRWQLEHPEGSIDACKTWLKELYETKQGTEAPPNKRPRK